MSDQDWKSGRVPPLETRAQTLKIMISEPGWKFEVASDNVVQARALADDCTIVELRKMVAAAAAWKKWNYTVTPAKGFSGIFIIKVWGRDE